MSILKIIVRFAFVLVLSFSGLTTSYAALVLKSSSLKVSVDQDTAQISDISLKIRQNESQTSVGILQAGSLLSLGFLSPLVLSSNELIEDNNNQTVIKSVFKISDGLLLIRNLQIGALANSILVRFELKNESSDVHKLASTGIENLRLGVGFNSISDEKGGYGSSIYAFRDPFISRNGEFLRVDVSEREQFESTSPLDWMGWVNRYYVVAIRSMRPQSSDQTKNKSKLIFPEEKDAELTPSNLIWSSQYPQSLPPGESFQFSYEIIAAAKNRALLSSTQPSLEGVVLMNLWDWFRWICSVISQLIHVLFSWTGNWGVTLILSALVVRVFTIPITRISLQYQDRATTQQLKMNTLTRELKEKYEGLDLSQRMVDMYEKEKFDHLLPFKSMLGLFIQIPIFIALFNVLAETPELSGVSFLWIHDLALSDRLFPIGVNLPFFGGYLNLLPFIMAIVTIASTYYASKDVTRKGQHPSALFGMAALFFILFYSFPAALVLYWTCSNLFQLLQQVIENKLARPNT